MREPDGDTGKLATPVSPKQTYSETDVPNQRIISPFSLYCYTDPTLWDRLLAAETINHHVRADSLTHGNHLHSIASQSTVGPDC